MTRHLLAITFVLTGCNSTPPPTSPAAPATPVLATPTEAGPVPPPAPPTVATDPLLARLDAIVGAKSTACVVERTRKTMDLAQIVTKGGVTRAVVRIGMFAHARSSGLSDGEQWAAWAKAAIYLGDLGDVEGARLALDRADEIDKRANVGGMHLNQTRVRVGRPVLNEAENPLGVSAIPALVLAGDKARAEQILAAKDPRRPDYGGPLRANDLTRALVALGRTDELPALAKGKEPQFVARLHRAWASEAMRHGRGVAEAIAAASAARTIAASDDVDLLEEVVAQAAHYGAAAAVASLRRDIAKAHVGKGGKRDRAADFVLLLAYRLSVIDGDTDEAAKLAKALATSIPLVKAQVPVVAAVYGGSLDEGLAAIAALAGTTPAETSELRGFYVGALWARHVAAGMDAAFDAKLAAAACAP